MYRLLLAISLFLSTAVFSQDTTPVITHPETTIDTSAMGKVLANSQRYLDSVNNAREYNGIAQTMKYLEEQQTEQRSKDRKKAILYIVLGVFFAVVFIAGMLRRRKNNTTPKI